MGSKITLPFRPHLRNALRISGASSVALIPPLLIVHIFWSPLMDAESTEARSTLRASKIDEYIATSNVENHVEHKVPMFLACNLYL